MLLSRSSAIITRILLEYMVYDTQGSICYGRLGLDSILSLGLLDIQAICTLYIQPSKLNATTHTILHQSSYSYRYECQTLHAQSV